MAETSIRGGAPMTRQRYVVVACLLIGGMINYIDRSTLAIAAPEMVKELGFSMTQIGLMGTVFA